VKPAKVRELSDEELKTKERELAEQLFKLRFQKAIGQLDNALKVRETRRDIARVKTIKRERESAAKAATEGAGR
jgi:large subunit ribosomal protein L29